MTNINRTLNPVTLRPDEIFSKTYSNATEEQQENFLSLQQTYAKLSIQLKEKELQCKKVSRQIGQAKREGLSTDTPIKAMQKHTAELNRLKTDIISTTEQAAAIFESRISNNIKTKNEPQIARSFKATPTTSSHISITLLTDKTDHWNDYVNSNTDASLYHRTEWKDLIHNVFGHHSYYFYAHNDKNETVGILPLVRLQSKLFGDFMVSMPYFNYGGALADSLQIEQELISAANNHASKLGINHIEYRDNIPRKDMQSRTEKVNMILALPNTHEILWESFSSKLRAQIKRPLREDTQTIIGNSECLNEFYTVFARNMRDLGTPVYSKTFFKTILETFPQNSRIVIIRLKQKPVAAAFLLGNGDVLEIPWASTLKDVNHLSINMMLYWEVLKFAIIKQYCYFDFGRSSKDSGTFRFKKQWGAEAKQMYWNYWLPDGSILPELNPSNPKYALVIYIWKRLPIWVTKLAGPFIVKNLP